MARLKSIELSGWKSIKHAEIELGSINVLIGANGSGKTNLISFFKLLHDMLREQFEIAVARGGGANSLLHYGAKHTDHIAADLRFEGDLREYGYEFRLSYAPPDTLVFAQERVGAWRGGSAEPDGWGSTVAGGRKETTLLRANPDGNSTAQRVRTLLVDSCRVYHFHDTTVTAPVRQMTYFGDNAHLRADAGNLAAVLSRIRTQDAAAYRRIVSTVRQINPRFGDFVLKREVSDSSKLMLNWQEFGREEVFGPHQLSDGTLRAIALVTLLLQPQDSLPGLIIVDEPELGLHPYAISVLAALFRKVSHYCQVVVSTQSVELLNYFGVEDVVVVDRAGEASQFKRLPAADLAGWLEDYAVGELWERNVFGGGPH